MKEHIFDYSTLTLDDIETLNMYHDYICDGNKKQIIVIEKEN